MPGGEAFRAEMNGIEDGAAQLAAVTRFFDALGARMDRLPAVAEAMPEVPLIGVGGIVDAADARAKIDAGASLVQMYTGFIYRGPALIGAARAALRT